MNKLLTGLFCSTLILGSAASFAQEVVLPGDSKGWFERQSNVGTIGLGGADSAGGTGSLSMVTTGSGGDILKIARIPISLPVTTVSSLTSIGWEVQTDNATSYPRPQIEYYDLFNQFGGRFGTLIYESGNQTPTADGATWNAYTVNFAGDLFRDSFSGDTKTLAEWQADPAVGGIPVNYFQIGYGSTGGSTTATTAIDFVELDGTTWDFEASVAPGLAADVSVVSTLETAGPFTAGDTVEYTVTVSNAGPDAATNIAVVGADASFGVPVNLTVTSVSGATCNANPCSIPSLASGGSEVIAVMATIQAAGQFSYPVGVLGDQDDPDFTNNASIPAPETAEAAPVVPQAATPVPTMSQWALILLGMIMAGIGMTRVQSLARD